MRALALCPAHGTPVERPRLCQIFVQLGVLLKLGNHFLELLVGTIDGSEFHRLDVLVPSALVGSGTKGPAHCHELAAHRLSTVAIHLLEQLLAATPAGILHLAWCPRVEVVFEGKHVLGVGIVEQLYKRLLAAVVVDNRRAVAHQQAAVLVAFHKGGVDLHENAGTLGDGAVLRCLGRVEAVVAGSHGHRLRFLARGGIGVLARRHRRCNATNHCCKHNACSNGSKTIFHA